MCMDLTPHPGFCPGVRSWLPNFCGTWEEFCSNAVHTPGSAPCKESRQFPSVGRVNECPPYPAATALCISATVSSPLEGPMGRSLPFPGRIARCPVGRYTGEYSTPVSKETPEDPILPSWKQRTKLRNGFALHQLYSSRIRATLPSRVLSCFL